MDKKRIAVAWPGFTGYMDACWRELSKTCDVRLFIGRGALEQRFDGSELAGLDWRRVEPGEISQAIADMHAFRPDAVLVCGWNTLLSRAVAREDFGCRKILLFDMPWKRSLRKFAARWALWPRLRHFDAAFVPGARTLKYAKWLGFEGRVATGSNPSGWERFHAAGHAAEGFVFVGRLSPEKNLDLLFDAYARYRTRVEKPWRLDIVGDGTLDRPPPEGVRLLGFVKPQDMPAVLSASAAFVLPSRWEPWGVSAMEAMSAGLSVIASDACGFVDDAPPSIVFKSGDAEALADALARVHGMSPAEREAAASAGRREARRYSASEWARRLLDVVFPPSRAIDFWEDHCTECGEPDCFKTCPKFRRGGHGRCERLVLDADKVSFRDWGKLELLWSGRLATREAVARARTWNRRREGAAKLLQRLLGWLPVPYGRGPYGIYRSLRWRKAARLARIPRSPRSWLFEASCPKPVSLAFEVRDAGKKVLLAKTFDFGPTPSRVEIPLPPIPKGARFSVRPADGRPAGPVRILENNLVAAGGAPVKCVAWDLDGTLWKGTLSEGDEVALLPASVKAVKVLEQRGIVNSICSKNDPDEALAKLAEFGLAEHFVFPQIGWGPKSGALARLAEEMNISAEAIVFVDDAEENRLEVADRLPQVRVLRPEDVTLALSLPEFNPAVSAESADRTRRYREEMARRSAARDFGGSAEAFAAESGLEVELLPVEGDRLARCLELVRRTNLLNLTARRYDADAFARLLETAESAAVRARDAYGDYGTVGFIAWRGTHLVECCFSCRIANRGVERRALDAVAAGRRFTADVVETPRNGPIRKLVEEWLACP